MNDSDDEDYFVPLTDQRVFGAGIKRKGIAFVAATNEERPISAPPAPTQSAGDRYLSIVLGKNVSQVSTLLPQNALSEVEQPVDAVVCAVCKQFVTAGKGTSVEAHESTIAHQVCMEHSHPPSHLDRSRKGLRYLSAHGWDPDARKGLGAREEGIRVPVKAREKRDTAGLGLDQEADDSLDSKKHKIGAKSEGKIVKLNFKEVRQMEEEKWKKAEKLRQVFYGEDLSEFLGPGA